MPSDSDEPPDAGTMRVHAVLADGRRLLDLSARRLWDAQEPRAPLLSATHDFIAAL